MKNNFYDVSSIIGLGALSIVLVWLISIPSHGQDEKKGNDVGALSKPLLEKKVDLDLLRLWVNKARTDNGSNIVLPLSNMDTDRFVIGSHSPSGYVSLNANSTKTFVLVDPWNDRFDSAVVNSQVEAISSDFRTGGGRWIHRFVTSLDEEKKTLLKRGEKIKMSSLSETQIKILAPAFESNKKTISSYMKDGEFGLTSPWLA